VIGELNIFINNVGGNIDFEEASCPGDGRIEYFKIIFRLYLCIMSVFLENTER
jgi:hypothetical protein